MPSEPKIDSYIAESAPFAQPILLHFRKLIHSAGSEIEESFKWSRPVYLYRGKLFCGTAAFKSHASFGFFHQGMEKLLSAEVGKTNEAMGLFGRITSLEDLPDDRTMVRYIKAAMTLHDSGAPARPKPKAKPVLKTPPDLAAALKKNKKSAAAWDGFSPSHRREYIEWITEAKRPETRETRLNTTVAWLAEGKKRNWKYENC